MTRSGLTAKQLACLEFIEAYVSERGYSPSYQEIMEGLGLRSKSGVYRLVKALQERGYIESLPNRARCILPLSTLPLGGIFVPLNEGYMEQLRELAGAAQMNPEEVARTFLTGEISRRHLGL